MLTEEQVERLALIREHHYCTVSDYGFCNECELIKIIDHLQAKLKELQEAAGPLNNKLEQYKLLPDESIMMLKIGDLRRLAEVVGRGNEY